MPSRNMQVTSRRTIHHEVSYDGEDVEYPAYDELEVRSKIPKEDLRPWGRQLYGFLGLFYLPFCIDNFWLALYISYATELQKVSTRTSSRPWVSKPWSPSCLGSLCIRLL